MPLGGPIQNVETLDCLRGSEFADHLTIATQANLLTVDGGSGDDVITAGGNSVTALGGSRRRRLRERPRRRQLQRRRLASTPSSSAAHAASSTLSVGVDGVSRQRWPGRPGRADLGRSCCSSAMRPIGLLSSAMNSPPTPLSASGRDDVIPRGFSGNDVLLGGEGSDRLSGLDGDDWLDGGPGTTCSTAARRSTSSPTPSPPPA